MVYISTKIKTGSTGKECERTSNIPIDATSDTQITNVVTMSRALITSCIALFSVVLGWAMRGCLCIVLVSRPFDSLA